MNRTVGASSHSWAELESLVDVGCVNRLVPVVLNTSMDVQGLLNQWEAQSRAEIGSCFKTSSSELEPIRNKGHSNSIEGVLHQLENPSKSEAPVEITFPDEDKGGRVKFTDKKTKSSDSVCVIDGGVSFADVAPWSASELLVRTRPNNVHFPWFEVCKQGSYEKRLW